MATCDACSGIFTRQNAIELLKSEDGLEYRRKHASMLTTALEGCIMCRELLCNGSVNWKDPDTGKYRLIQENDADTTTIKRWPILLWEHEKRKQLSSPFSRAFDTEHRFRFHGDVASKNFITCRLKHQLRKDDSKVPLHFNISAGNGDPIAKFFRQQQSNFDVNDTRTWSQIREWLQKCDSSHQSCKEFDVGFTGVYPSRVLDVATLGDAKIRLTDVSTNNTKYAALSYCWGAPQPNALKLDNHAAYLETINVETLPQSIKDAVTATRLLGLRYLWVDSLCILQDSEDDKAQELGRMAGIYANAYITISASIASTCNSGFLSQRCVVEPQRFSLPFCCSDGQIGAVSLLGVGRPLLDSAGDMYWPITFPLESPIMQRAWTFQERFMSHRIIFGHEQLFWSCPEYWGRDGGSLTKGQYFYETGKSMGIDLAPNNFESLSAFTLPNPTRRDWQNIVKLYMRTNITMPEDKLPAISSLAEYFASKMNDEYIAGLWRSTLLQDMMWHRGACAEFEKMSTTRSPLWRAPSWSFFSVDGDIIFEEWDSKKYKSMVTIRGYTISPKSTAATFGQLQSGGMRIVGKLLPVKVFRYGLVGYFAIHASSPLPDLNKIEPDDTNYRKSTIAQVFFDALVPAGVDQRGWPNMNVVTNFGGVHSANTEVYFLPLGRGDDSYKVGNTNIKATIVWGLALGGFQNNNYLHRIGHIQSWKMASELFDGIPEVDINFF